MTQNASPAAAKQTATPAVVHSTFEIERVYPTTAAKAFHAFSDMATKRRWFVEGEGWTIDDYQMDFRTGGREFSAFRFGDGPAMTNETLYHDIIPNERMIFTYKMTVGDAILSVSLATITLKPDAKGTLMTYVEQGAYMGGNPDEAKMRHEGCAELFEALAKELAR